MSLDRLAYNALSRLDASAGKGARPGKPARTDDDRLPPGRHRLVFHTAPYAIVLVDGRGRVRDVNNEAVRLSGWTREELRRTTFNALVRLDGRPRPGAAVRQWTGVLERPNGDRREVDVVQGPPLGEAEGLGLRPYFVVDRAAEREERERCRAVDRVDALGGFAHGLALEMANRLTALVGHLEMLAEGLERDHPGGERLADARRSVDTLEALARDVGALGRLEKARVERVDLAALLRELEPKLRQGLPEGIVLDVAVAGETLPVSSDARFLERALLLLQRQACRAMPRGGMFGLTARPAADRGRVELEVCDTGAPIAAAQVDRAFVPFTPLRVDHRDAACDLALAHFLLVRSGASIAVDTGFTDGLALVLTLAAVDS